MLGADHSEGQFIALSNMSFFQYRKALGQLFARAHSFEFRLTRCSNGVSSEKAKDVQ